MNRGAKRRREAFTLVEAIVFTTIAIVAFAGLIAIFTSTQREAAKTQLHARGLQAANVLVARLSGDLRSGIFFENPYTQRPFQLVTRPDGSAVDFFQYENDPRKPPPAPVDAAGVVNPVTVRQVRYAFDSRTGAVVRTIAGSSAEALPIKLLSLRFELGSASPTPPPAGAPAFLQADNLLKVTLEWVPEELANLPAERQPEKMTFATSFGLDGEAIMRAHPNRNLNPTSKFVVEEL